MNGIVAAREGLLWSHTEMTGAKFPIFFISRMSNLSVRLYAVGLSTKPPACPGGRGRHISMVPLVTRVSGDSVTAENNNFPLFHGRRRGRRRHRRRRR